MSNGQQSQGVNKTTVYGNLKSFLTLFFDIIIMSSITYSSLNVIASRIYLNCTNTIVIIKVRQIECRYAYASHLA